MDRRLAQEHPGPGSPTVIGLDVAPDSVWVAAFCLRTYDYRPIIETLSAHGLQTERLPQTFPQRRFTNPEEEQWAVAEVRKRRFDPAGKEAEG